MPVILVLADDTATRDALTDTLRRLFPRARVIATRTDAEPATVEREAATVILTTLPIVERLCRETACLAARTVALTHAMGPDTLMRAEALGVRASLRAPASAEHLRTVLGPMLDG